MPTNIAPRAPIAAGCCASTCGCMPGAGAHLLQQLARWPWLMLVLVIGFIVTAAGHNISFQHASATPAPRWLPATGVRLCGERDQERVSSL